MQCNVYRGSYGAYQKLGCSWEGADVAPPVEFRFALRAGRLCFEARRAAPAVIHPSAAPGVFCEELWRYDVAEFFVATADAQRYLEVNVCPNGAWWAAGFTKPRVPLRGFAAAELQAEASGEMSALAWCCRVSVAQAALEKWGWQLEACRLASAAVICRNGAYTYLTTCDRREGKPDFHHPWDWEAPLLNE